jgi:hypothetical protein
MNKITLIKYLLLDKTCNKCSHKIDCQLIFCIHHNEKQDNGTCFYYKDLDEIDLLFQHIN